MHMGNCVFVFVYSLWLQVPGTTTTIIPASWLADSPMYPINPRADFLSLLAACSCGNFALNKNFATFILDYNVSSRKMTATCWYQVRLIVLVS